MTTKATFPIFYLPPISYFKALKEYNFEVNFELFEHFPKQTYRNRMQVYSPNGMLQLSIPIQKGGRLHTQMKDVRISYTEDWQRLHWMSLRTCYRSSAYFEYYESEFEVFYQNKIERLADYNLSLLKLIAKCLKIEIRFNFTAVFHKDADHDYRSNIHPKKESLYDIDPYYQVFEEKHGFLNDLSIVDLLFNQGPQASQFI